MSESPNIKEITQSKMDSGIENLMYKGLYEVARLMVNEQQAFIELQKKTIEDQRKVIADLEQMCESRQKACESYEKVWQSIEKATFVV